jgi:hypothetical protein
MYMQHLVFEKGVVSYLMLQGESGGVLKFCHFYERALSNMQCKPLRLLALQISVVVGSS